MTYDFDNFCQGRFMRKQSWSSLLVNFYGSLILNSHLLIDHVINQFKINLKILIRTISAFSLYQIIKPTFFAKYSLKVAQSSGVPPVPETHA